MNVFMGLPGDGARLELTYNHGVDSYDLGTGYNHIAITAEDLDGTLARLAEQGIEPEKPPYTRARGRLAAVLRARPGRLPHRAHREQPGAAVVGSGPWTPGPPPSSTSGRTRSGSSSSPRAPAWWKRTDEIYEAVRIGAGARGDRELGEEPIAAGAGDRSRCSRTSAGPRASSTTDIDAVATSAIRDAENARGFLARARASGLPIRVLSPRGGGALRLPRRGELDDAVRRRRARPRRRLHAARPRRRAAGRSSRAPGRSAPCA